MQIARFTFNSFMENTYVLFDDTAECVIIDPGCFDAEEQKELAEFIHTKGLKPVKLLLTHCHIDHVLGNNFVFDRYGLRPHIHSADEFLLRAVSATAAAFGLSVPPSPEPEASLSDGGTLKFGSTVLELIHTPGHSPGSICFYHRTSGNLIGGDVLFEASIGRTDLPGGDYDTLMRSIIHRLFLLPDATVVHPGHGDPTSIGFEKSNNPFVLSYSS